MSSDVVNAFAATMSAIAAIAAFTVALIGLRESRRHILAVQRQSAHAMDLTLQSRLDPMYPGLRLVLGDVQDGVPKEIRDILIPFVVLFSDAYAAYRDGLLDDRDWIGFSQEMTYWMQKANAKRAWGAFRQQTWTEGFVDFVDNAIAGPPAYPDLKEQDSSNLGLDWD